jgi:hypothetical protein
MGARRMGFGAPGKPCAWPVHKQSCAPIAGICPIANRHVSEKRRGKLAHTIWAFFL